MLIIFSVLRTMIREMKEKSPHSNLVSKKKKKSQRWSVTRQMRLLSIEKKSMFDWILAKMIVKKFVRW